MLKAGKWKEADQETTQRMCQVMGRQKEGFLRVEDAEQFPCIDLRTIDQLWVKYSNGKFGFSVQKQIWQECGSPTLYTHNTGWENWEKFGDRVGWIVESKWIKSACVKHDLSAPPGHLPDDASRGQFLRASLDEPTVFTRFGVGGRFHLTSSLLRRMADCTIQ